MLMVEALKAQLEEQTRLCSEQVCVHVSVCLSVCSPACWCVEQPVTSLPIWQVDALLEERRVATEEASARADRDEARIASLSEQLRTTQALLYESTRDFLNLKYNARSSERQWMSEKDELLRKLDHCR